MKLPYDATIIISGHTFPHRERLKDKFGLQWEPLRKEWHGALNVFDQKELITFCKNNQLSFIEIDWIKRKKNVPQTQQTISYYIKHLNGGKVYCLDNHTTKELVSQKNDLKRYKRTRIGEKVYNFKYHNDNEAGQQVANDLSNLAKALSFDRGDLIIPAPPTVNRGTCQPVFFIAKELAKNIDVPFVEALTSYNQLQQKMTKDNKNTWKELTKAIGLTSKCSLSGKNVILVDDIYGTGLTIDVCSTKLMQAGAKKVASLVVTKKKS